MSFTHLHLHTQYSLLDSSSKIKELVKRAVELGMDSLAITDHGVMYGVIDFYEECKKNGIKPILGCEVYVAPDSRFEKGSGNSVRYHHLVLLSENMTGYKNLMKLVSRGFIEGFYYKPRVDYELLEQYHEGLIATSACLSGIVSSHLKEGNFEKAKEEALRLNQIFGQGSFFLELQDHGLPIQKYVNQNMVALSNETGIPLVATNDCHYILEEDAASHDVLLCIGTQKKLNDEDRMRYEGGKYYLKSEAEMRELFHYIPEAIDNTGEIAKRCNVEITFGEYHLPEYPVPEGTTSVEYLKKVCEEGFKKRYPEEEYSKEELLSLRERLDYELQTITGMGFVDYFLIVWDYIRFAKDNGIIVGAGRGSAAGSMVSYCLEITGIDPIKYNLLFERFLNPERLTMPDIDIDFCVKRRGEVIDYVTKKYGRDRVVQIVTFGTMAARMVIRDVGRVLDLPYGYCDKVAKMIPNELKMTIEKALDVNPDLKELYNSEDEARLLIDLSKSLEGLPRHVSVHAAGIVISKDSVDEYVPLSIGSEGVVTTQFTMNTLERLGLLKMDFLGLRNLTVIQSAVDLINTKRRKRGEKEFDLSAIRFDDKKIFEMLGQGKTEGVFQLESKGMKAFMTELKPDNLEDIIAGISLYRPGPMDFIPKYIEGKKNKNSITYDCKELIPILKATHGCIVYQEQVMQIVRDLAGYSYGRSDLLRRAMSKKKGDVIIRDRNNFVYGNPEEGVKGCVANGIDEKTAHKIYDDMLDFANYAFNRSHAAAYAVITYQTAYLKYYYQKEYMAALLSSVFHNVNKISEYIETCRKMGIKLLLPDINEGEGEFTASEEGVRYGLSAIKGLGEAVIEDIIRERRERGEFRSLSDFINRLSVSGINKKNIEGLIKAGAFDRLPGTRKEKLSSYLTMLESATHERSSRMAGQLSFFDFMPEEELAGLQFKMPKLGEFHKKDLLFYEKEMTGVYLSGNPLEDYIKLLEVNCTAQSSDFLLDEEEGGFLVADGDVHNVGGIINKITVKYTRNNTRMAILELEDMVGTLEVILFERVFDRYFDLLKEEEMYIIRGRARVSEDRGANLIAENIVPFAQVPHELWLQFKNKAEYEVAEADLLNIFEERGNHLVKVYCKEEKVVKPLQKLGKVGVDARLFKELQALYGDENVKIVIKSIEQTAKMY